MSMAENIAGVAGSAMITALFKPTLSVGILKFWQGIVEIALRVGSLVLLFILFICCCTALSNVNAPAAGWLLFVTIVAAIVEGLILVSRFLNFGFISKFATIVHIVDIVISFVTAAAIFCGAVAIAVFAGTLADSLSKTPLGDQFKANSVGSTGATSAFGFFSLFVFVGLGVFMILSMVFKWENTTEYSAPSASGGVDEAGDERTTKEYKY